MEVSFSANLYAAVKDLVSWASRRLFPTRLEISYNPSITPDKDRVVDAGNRWACFYHLAVRNMSRKTAVGCRGSLRVVSPMGVEPSHQRWLKKPEILKWANETGYHTIDIEPGEKRRLDFVYVFEDDPRFRFFFERASPPVGNEREFPSGRYEAQVRVTAKNCPSIAIELLVDGDGSWDTVRIKEI